MFALGENIGASSMWALISGLVTEHLQVAARHSPRALRDDIWVRIGGRFIDIRGIDPSEVIHVRVRP